jgi:predicted Rossmann fold flavoprotein
MITTSKKQMQEDFLKNLGRGIPRHTVRIPHLSLSAPGVVFCYASSMPRVAVVGGGPAGFMAAIASAESISETTLFDAALPLAKLMLTGGGRCNLSHAILDPRELAEQYPRGGKFLTSVFSRFGVKETLDWFTSRRLRLVTEADGRIFPASGRAADVRDLLASEARRHGVRVRARLAVTAVEREQGAYRLVTARGAEVFDRVVIATGGDWKDPPGSGYRLARALGHGTTALAPSLTGLETAEPWPGALAGLSIAGATLRAAWDGKTVAEERGDLVFTHRGLSGPGAFRISSRCAFLPVSRRAPLLLTLSPTSCADAHEVEKILLGSLAARPRQQVSSALRSLAPGALADQVLFLAGVEPTMQGSQLSREARRSVARMLDRIPLTVTGRDKGSEMVTAGGVPLEQVHPGTFESRISPGLYFCGEVLDIDGFTGGFNLQAAWSTGHAAGLFAGLAAGA